MHSSILAWRIPWTEEPGGLQSIGSQRDGLDRATNTHTTEGNWSSILRNASAIYLSCLIQDSGELGHSSFNPLLSVNE